MISPASKLNGQARAMAKQAELSIEEAAFERMALDLFTEEFANVCRNFKTELRRIPKDELLAIACRAAGVVATELVDRGSLHTDRKQQCPKCGECSDDTDWEFYDRNGDTWGQCPRCSRNTIWIDIHEVDVCSDCGCIAENKDHVCPPDEYDYNPADCQTPTMKDHHQP